MAASSNFNFEFLGAERKLFFGEPLARPPKQSPQIVSYSVHSPESMRWSARHVLDLLLPLHFFLFSTHQNQNQHLHHENAVADNAPNPPHILPTIASSSHRKMSVILRSSLRVQLLPRDSIHGSHHALYHSLPRGRRSHR